MSRREAARAAGVLLHPTSLPGRFGAGDLGPGADRFLDWAARAGHSLWQVLPLSPTGAGDSPYGGASAFAGNPFLISPEILTEEGLLDEASLDGAPSAASPDRVDFSETRRWKDGILRRSFERSRGIPALAGAVRQFAEAPEQRAWLPDWTLFAALKEAFGHRPWSAWKEPLAFREADAIADARRELEEEIAFQEYVQFLFFHQWERVQRAAHARGIALFGDIPIYLAMDSADVWAHPELFQLDADRRPAAVSGVPPDYFSETGQLWGNPLYDWLRIEEDGFSWWIARLRANLRLVDLLRLDHFRGFAGYWAVPAKETTAIAGEWLPGPGLPLFQAAEKALGSPLPLIAEDLGVITDDVRLLLSESGLPGMKVLQFAFSEEDSEHQPHRFLPASVVYTGTHDNDTARGWFAAAGPEERARALDYLGGDGAEIHWDLIRAAYTSVAERAIAPLQDILGLGSDARMNNPAKPGGNWGWRARDDVFDPAVADRLKRLAKLTGRIVR